MEPYNCIALPTTWLKCFQNRSIVKTLDCPQSEYYRLVIHMWIDWFNTYIMMVGATWPLYDGPFIGLTKRQSQKLFISQPIWPKCGIACHLGPWTNGEKLSLLCKHIFKLTLDMYYDLSTSGPRLNIKMSTYQYRKSHYGRSYDRLISTMGFPMIRPAVSLFPHSPAERHLNKLKYFVIQFPIDAILALVIDKPSHPTIYQIKICQKNVYP